MSDLEDEGRKEDGLPPIKKKIKSILKRPNKFKKDDELDKIYYKDSNSNSSDSPVFRDYQSNNMCPIWKHILKKFIFQCCPFAAQLTSRFHLFCGLLKHGESSEKDQVVNLEEEHSTIMNSKLLLASISLLLIFMASLSWTHWLKNYILILALVVQDLSMKFSMLFRTSILGSSSCLLHFFIFWVFIKNSFKPHQNFNSTDNLIKVNVLSFQKMKSQHMLLMATHKRSSLHLDLLSSSSLSLNQSITPSLLHALQQESNYTSFHQSLNYFKIFRRKCLGIKSSCFHPHAQIKDMYLAIKIIVWVRIEPKRVMCLNSAIQLQAQKWVLAFLVWV